jgi:membrane protease YdiL (CAAX protease family)
MTTARLLVGFAVEVAILAAVASILRIRGWDFSRITERFTGAAAASGIALAIAYFFLYWFLALMVASFLPRGTNLGIHVRWLAPMALIVVQLIVNSLYEELLVAGYVITALREQGAAYAITASTLLRFAYHLYQGPMAVISILPMGLLFGVVYWRSRSVWPLVVAHTLLNLGSVLFTTR